MFDLKLALAPLTFSLALGACRAGALDLGTNDAVDGGGDSGGPVFVSQVLMPVTPEDGTCVYSADVNAAFLATGTVDVSFPDVTTYTPTLLVGDDGASQPSQQAASARVTLQGAVTRITDLQGNTSLLPLLAGMCQSGAGDDAACTTGKALQAGTLATPVNPFATAETAPLPLPSGSTPSYTAIGVTIVDGATIDVLRSYFRNALETNGAGALQTSIQLLTYTKVQGTTLGGSAVESGEFEFPVTFTYGGLVSNLEADLTSPVGYCLASFVVPSAPQTCVAGQDIPAIVSALAGVSACTPSADAGADTDAGAGVADAAARPG
jgi:hypothetical protein